MFKGCHFPKPVILTCIRWYLRYKLSYRDLEEMLAERGVSVDHATINRWVLKFSPLLAWNTITGLELVHMIRKGQVRPLSHGSDAQQFEALAA